VANSTTVNSGGWMTIRSGGTATNIIAADSAFLRIVVAPDTYVQGTYAGSAFEMKDAYISGYTLNRNCDMDISSGGVADSTTVNSGGWMVIDSGVANSTTVNSGGSLSIHSGGTATNIVAEDGARVNIPVASNTYIQGTYNGSAFEMKDAYISGYTVNSGGKMRISSGGVRTALRSITDPCPFPAAAWRIILMLMVLWIFTAAAWRTTLSPIAAGCTFSAGVWRTVLRSTPAAAWTSPAAVHIAAVCRLRKALWLRLMKAVLSTLRLPVALLKMTI